ncbi:hypothetical protein ACS0TY_030758 [Phlomoides rotata]
MQAPSYTPIIKYTCAVEDEGTKKLQASVRAVEKILKYDFNNKKLLADALTHSSYGGSPSYQRLEFVGDAALDLAFTNFVFLHYPGKLSLVRAANINTEKLARVSVRHHLYNYVRHNVNALDKKVREFVMTLQEEVEAEIYGGLVKAPKVLTDIIESLAAVVYIDCNFNLEMMWKVSFHSFSYLICQLCSIDQLIYVAKTHLNREMLQTSFYDC